MRYYALPPPSLLFDDSDLFEMKRTLHGRDSVTDNWIGIHSACSAHHNFFFSFFIYFLSFKRKNVENMISYACLCVHCVQLLSLFKKCAIEIMPSSFANNFTFFPFIGKRIWVEWIWNKNRITWWEKKTPYINAGQPKPKALKINMGNIEAYPCLGVRNK